jgi:hypothetical protein
MKQNERRGNGTLVNKNSHRKKKRRREDFLQSETNLDRTAAAGISKI